MTFKIAYDRYIHKVAISTVAYECQPIATVQSYTTKDCDEELATIEEVLCDVDDLKENDIKTFSFSNDAGKVLLIKRGEKISALGTKCTHYGALLEKGALGNNHIRCPWHGACFNIETGDIEDFPGLDSIPCYQVRLDGNKVRVRAKRKELENHRKLRDMVLRDSTDERVFVIVGGGPSGGVCAETLRQQGFGGRIVMLCKENFRPYDRVKISKALDLDPGAIQFRDENFYDKYSIETMLGVEATKVNTQNNTVNCSNGFVIKYDKLYLATGSKAFKPNIPGSDLKNVVTLRTCEDSTYVSSLINPDSQIVCLGSSFISLEAAASYSSIVKKVTVVARDRVPLRLSFGEEVGARILELFRSKNVDMIMESGIKQCIGVDGVLSAVELIDGTQIPCDVCVMGTGSRFYTDFLKDSQINMNTNGSIDVDMHLMTNIPNVYAGGDIANAPVYPNANQRLTIGHYQLAQYHGRIAAMNMVGNAIELKAVPFFWTVLFNISFRYSGHGVAHEAKIVGNIDDLSFVAFYFDQNGNVIGMGSCMRDPIVAQFAELQRNGIRLNKNDLVDDPFAWTKSIITSAA